MSALLEVENLRTWFYTRQGIVKAVKAEGFGAITRRIRGLSAVAAPYWKSRVRMKGTAMQHIL